MNRRLLIWTLIALTPAQSVLAGGYFKTGYYPLYSYGYQAPYSLTYYDEPYGSYWQGRYYPPGRYAWHGYEKVWYKDGYPYHGEAYAPSYKVEAPAYTADWKTKVVGAAEKRDDHIAYLKALDALGLPQPGQYPPGKARYAAAHGSYFAPQGQTQYGFTFETIRAAYGDTDLTQLYQTAGNLTKNAQQLAGQAHTEFSGLVSQAGDNAGRVAEILARGQSARVVLDGTNPQGRSVEANRVTVQGAAPTVLPRVEDPAPAPAPNGNFLQEWGRPYCASCHGAKDAKGGFQIDLYPGMTPEQKETVWAYVLANKCPPAGSKKFPAAGKRALVAN